MTTPHSIDQLVRTKRRWLVNLWLSGLLLALAIILGLGVTLWRLQETMELVDDSTLSEAAYEQMVAKSVTAGRAGLAIGTLAFLGYLISMLMHQRAKQQLRTARDEQRHQAILHELAEQEPDPGTPPAH